MPFSLRPWWESLVCPCNLPPPHISDDKRRLIPRRLAPREETDARPSPRGSRASGRTLESNAEYQVEMETVIDGSRPGIGVKPRKGAPHKLEEGNHGMEAA